MCGIAGYSLDPDSSVDRTLAAQALLAGIAERGADAVGYAYRGPARLSRPSSSSARRPAASSSASRFRRTRPSCSSTSATTRRATPRSPPTTIPSGTGPVVGIHNGIIVNDDEILGCFDCARSEPRMTVDSEAIFAVAAHSRADARALEDLRGAMATAWLDERAPGRPLSPPAVWAGRSGSARPRSTSSPPRARARGRRALRRCPAAQAGRSRGDIPRGSRRRGRPA